MTNEDRAQQAAEKICRRGTAVSLPITRDVAEFELAQVKRIILEYFPQEVLPALSVEDSEQTMEGAGVSKITETPDAKIAEIRERRFNLSSPPFEVVAGDNCGSYGNGPDTRGVFVSYAVVDSEGRTIVDTYNSTATEVHEDVDEDGLHTWDEVGRNNVSFFANAPTDIDFLLVEVQAAYIKGYEQCRSDAANITILDSILDWAGGSTGDAKGTAIKIGNAIINLIPSSAQKEKS